MEHKITNRANTLTVRVQCVLFKYFGCSVCFVELFWMLKRVLFNCFVCSVCFV
jgi:hypothetical protein